MKKIIFTLMMLFSFSAFADYCDSTSSPIKCYNDNINMRRMQLNVMVKKILASNSLTNENKNNFIDNVNNWSKDVDSLCRQYQSVQAAQCILNSQIGYINKISGEMKLNSIK